METDYISEIQDQLEKGRQLLNNNCQSDIAQGTRHLSEAAATLNHVSYQCGDPKLNETRQLADQVMNNYLTAAKPFRMDHEPFLPDEIRNMMRKYLQPESTNPAEQVDAKVAEIIGIHQQWHSTFGKFPEELTLQKIGEVRYLPTESVEAADKLLNEVFHEIEELYYSQRLPKLAIEAIFDDRYGARLRQGQIFQRHNLFRLGAILYAADATSSHQLDEMPHHAVFASGRYASVTATTTALLWTNVWHPVVGVTPQPSQPTDTFWQRLTEYCEECPHAMVQMPPKPVLERLVASTQQTLETNAGLGRS